MVEKDGYLEICLKGYILKVMEQKVQTRFRHRSDKRMAQEIWMGWK